MGKLSLVISGLLLGGVYGLVASGLFDGAVELPARPEMKYGIRKVPPP